jgi:hypothetical protein
VTFLLLFLPVCNYHNRKGKILSSQGKKQNEASLSGSYFMIFYIKKALFGQKNRALLGALLKNENVFAYNSRTDRYISKIPRDLDSAGQKHFSCLKKSLQNSVALLKI